MNTINALAFIVLLIPGITFACPIGSDCQLSLDAEKKELYNKAPDATENHDHNDPNHRAQIILDSHEFASKTCSYDVNCDAGYKCDLQRKFHKGICVRER